MIQLAILFATMTQPPADSTAPAEIKHPGQSAGCLIDYHTVEYTTASGSRRTGASQTWQTNRGGTGLWHNFEVLRIDTDAVAGPDDTGRVMSVGREFQFVPQHSRDNFLNFDGQWNVYQVVALTDGSVSVLQLDPESSSPQEEPAPPVVTPAPTPGILAPPSDAIVLFDGTNADAWSTMDGQPSTWAAKGRFGSGIAVKPGAGPIITRRKFGDCQLHVEFLTPKEDAEAGKTGQDRGNSGVYIQGRYEVQILDSYQNETYPDGQCGAFYKQHIPLVNACRPPGEWQTYDIVFHAARFNEQGQRTAKARATVLHNGVLIQDDVELDGPTGYAPFKEEPGDGPIYLQDHGNHVGYRNIWIRPLK